MSFAQVVITPGYNWQVFENPVLLVRRLKKSPGKSVMSCRNKYVLRIHWTLESSRDYGRNIAWVVPSPCWRDDESRNNRFRESDEIIQTTPRQDANGVYTSDRSRIHRSSGTGLVERQDCMRLGASVHYAATRTGVPENPGCAHIHRTGRYSIAFDEHPRADRAR